MCVCEREEERPNAFPLQNKLALVVSALFTTVFTGSLQYTATLGPTSLVGELVWERKLFNKWRSCTFAYNYLNVSVTLMENQHNPQ